MFHHTGNQLHLWFGDHQYERDGKHNRGGAKSENSQKAFKKQEIRLEKYYSTALILLGINYSYSKRLQLQH